MENVKASKTVSKVYNKIIVYLSYLAGILLSLITLSVTAEIVVRKFTNSSLPWVIECSEHALVFITFLAAAWVLREDAQIKVDLVLSHLSRKKRALLNIFNSLLGGLLCGFISYRSALTVLDLSKRNIYTIKTLEIPMAPLYSVICLGSLLLTIQFFIRAYGYFGEWKENRNIQ
jgi:TRAP-type C4-dicarboxylate transport system permease small subunit